MTTTPNAEVISLQFQTMNQRFDEHKIATDKRFDKSDMDNAEIKKLISNLTKDLKDELKDFKGIFATKEEHKNNQEKIKETQERVSTLEQEKKSLMKETLKWFAIAVGGAVFGYITSLLQGKI